MNVVFDEDNTSSTRRPIDRTGTVTKLVIKYSGGYISTPAGASVAMLVAALVFFIFSIILVTTLVIPPPAEPIFSPYDG